MKKMVHKNQIIITALAVMIVVAGYLNFTGQEITTGGFGLNVDKQKTAEKKEAGTKTAEEDTKAQEEDGEAQSSEEDKSDQAEDAQTTDISDEDSAGNALSVNDNGEVVASQENPGEAVMVSNVIGSDYFSSAKLSREQTRAKNKETLMEIVNNETLSSADKKAAVQEVAEITENAQRESDAEMMLEAKGFADAMVSINDGKADVVVDAENLSAKEMAQIVDIVKRKTNISADQIVVTPVSVKKE
ncbi:MAG: SpoIIIAH-like family protein [Lachnospiraceae bacterium]|nr:SpoIIIAH-like family protein [Lachnospiraceae bacterium]